MRVVVSYGSDADIRPLREALLKAGFECRGEDCVPWEGLDVSNFDDPESMSGGTALCPNCGTDAVIGDRSGYPIEPSFLTRMNEAWFQRTIIRKPASKT